MRRAIGDIRRLALPCGGDARNDPNRMETVDSQPRHGNAKHLASSYRETSSRVAVL